MKRPLTVLIVVAASYLLAPTAWAKWPTKRSPDPEWGEGLYQKHCWQCHGRQAEGDGPSAAAMKAAVPSLRGRSNHDSRSELVSLARQGQGPMPGYHDSISRQDLRRIFVYIESLDRPPEPEEEEEEEDGDEVPENDAPADEEGDAPADEEGDAPADEEPEAGGE